VKVGSALSVRRLCQATGLSRAGYYRFRGRVVKDRNLGLRRELQRLAVRWPTYGYRRAQGALDKGGERVNHKRVQRIRREENLQCVRRRWRVRTTDSDHNFRVYPNLAGQIELNGLNQLWVADITYIRVEASFLYLAVILDAYSRRVIGWELSNSLSAEVALTALRQAIKARRFAPGLVHHSDRGVQYAAQAYTQLLRRQQIQISMSRRGNPYDNAQAESFFKTLKYEEVNRNDYQNQFAARHCLKRFLNQTYNHQRLHSALGYLAPAEFERRLRHTKKTEKSG
jgi:putative transposase